MRDSSPSGSQSVERALALLQQLADHGPDLAVADAAGQLGIKVSTAYRLVAQLQRAGLLVRSGRGRYSGGLALQRLAQRVDCDAIVCAVARPVLKALSKATGRVAHLGVFDDDMVMYLVREAPARASIFTREGMQLEAYCTAVGKVLLAGLPPPQRDAYLSAGAFVPLTPKTIVSADALRAQLATVAATGFARDDEESNDGLFCVAVPVETAGLGRDYALSISGPWRSDADERGQFAAIKAAAATLTMRLA